MVNLMINQSILAIAVMISLLLSLDGIALSGLSSAQEEPLQELETSMTDPSYQAKEHRRDNNDNHHKHSHENHHHNH
ncbi:hypothetical protein [Roseofilum sp. Guam]|uniref:hypothetical protein n=1 Tax=Roseofilum sp. Guam TaxID=2821502 RepID=UPI001B230A49|nr:hypothetical protein [Roseofilum sp. Guam]MBP0028414.1 hypothetical protein [Roseofilum sp. Guam]